MPIPGAPTDSQTPLADLLGGVNRPQLNAFVANSQARNGLVSAQTQEAMIKASQAQEEQQARQDLNGALVAAGHKQSDANLLTDIMVGGLGNAESAFKAYGLSQIAVGGNPSNPNPAQVTQGSQVYQGHPLAPVAVPGTSIMPPGSSLAGAPVQQTPLAAAQTAAANATAGLHNVQAAAGGWNPHSGMGATFSPEENAALANVVNRGAYDPTRLNSRTGHIIAAMEMANPGVTDFNRLHADAALQSNATFQQRAMSVDMLPGLLSHVTSLGKKLNGGTGYSDIKSVGQMQQFMNGQLNDPDYTEYMTARNDTLLRLASVMRGVGMSDQAHTAEVQAMAPTLAPYALDAWLKGQMAVVQPLLDRQNRITHLGEPGAGTAPLNAPTSAPNATSTAAPTPLRDQLPGGATGPGGAPAFPSFPSEAAARAAGHGHGEYVIIGGVGGTLD